MASKDSMVFNYWPCPVSIEPGRALAVQGQPTRGAEAAAAGSGLLCLHCTGKWTSSLVLGFLPTGWEPVSTLPQGITKKNCVFVCVGETNRMPEKLILFENDEKWYWSTDLGWEVLMMWLNIKCACFNIWHVLFFCLYSRPPSTTISP